MEESREQLAERHNRELFTKEIVFSLLSPDFENIGISTSASKNSTTQSTKKPQPSDSNSEITTSTLAEGAKKKTTSSVLPPSPSENEGGKNTDSNETVEQHEQNNDSVTTPQDNCTENGEITVTRTSINNELLGAASGGGEGELGGASATATDRIFRTKQRAASNDVSLTDDAAGSSDNKNRSDESVS